MADPQDYSILVRHRGIIVVNKLKPLPVLPDIAGGPNLRDMVRKALGLDCLETVNRIDRPVSGIVCMASDSPTHARLSTAFRDRGVVKLYLAAVTGEPPGESGRLDQLIGWNKEKSKAFVGPLDPSLRGGKIRRDMKQASLSWKLAAKTDRYWILEVRLETGRHHQIRAQLASIGCPVRGDVKYGAKRPNPSGLINLHAWKLELPEEFGLAPLTARLPEGDPIWEAFSGDHLIQGEIGKIQG
jgi:23S rRNA pseudouridine1911/1915/1917 synthase